MAQQHVCNEMGKLQTKHDIFSAIIEKGATLQGFTAPLKGHNFEAKTCSITGKIFNISVTEHFFAH